MPRNKINDYIIDMDSCLGEGAFGEVYRGTEEKTKKDVAIKVLSKKKSKLAIR
jgi:serine/threonine protein kinase